MHEKLRHTFALSDKGAKDMVKAFSACILHNLSLMVPVVLLYNLIGDLLGEGIPEGKSTFYIAGLAMALGLIMLTYYIQYNATFFATYVESGVRRLSLAEKLRKIPLSFFGKKDLSDLTTVLMADCATLEGGLSHWVPEFIGSLISTLLIAAGLFVFDWRMALASLWVLPVSFGIILATAGIMRIRQEKVTEVSIACSDGIQECLETLRDLKANNAEDGYLKGLDKKIKDVEKYTVIGELTNAVFHTCGRMVLKVGIATTVLAGGALLADGEITLLTFFAFMILVSRVYDPLIAALDNLSAVIMIRNIQCRRMDEILSHPEQEGRSELTNRGYDIIFDHVGFSYECSSSLNSGETVLKDVSFTAKQGQVTALVGPSGGGKTTVSRLASRFWDIQKGKITVGGMDISKIEPETLMSLYSIVFQDVTLFNNTVMENIRLGRKDATDAEVLEAARLANVDEFAEKLPDKWNTLIGENGCELSGGERQRISIARAFLKNAPIILLDEATASLDVENETLIQESLSRLIENKTVMIIAHRMRTVAGADKIVVLSEGTVAEQGSSDMLLKKDGIYARMVKLQTQSRNWAME
ncbi:ABC transporter ATP-binding protein [Acetatifactor aquisgranensis]|uniref:ABC transporter ATP-binding protein n=1 Tax=Acetatifactor aquisgranensis TaxID=2941233 RepID=UPI0020402F00|nr:ABC transporter ATP-binding protein [Acetatifactor aquisgranensis]